jgi:hypothetical protein
LSIIAAQIANAFNELNRILDRMTDIRISESRHGPADARRYSYEPTWQMRGLTNLHLEFDVALGYGLARVHTQGLVIGWPRAMANPRLFGGRPVAGTRTRVLYRFRRLSIDALIRHGSVHAVSS